jgi:hypothetical protein
MMAAADHNPRIKAAAFHRPIYGGAIGAKNFPSKAIAQVWADRESRIAEGSTEPTHIKTWPDSLENAVGEGEPAVVPGMDAYNLIPESLLLSEAAGTPWKNKVTLRSIHYWIRTEADEYLPRITVPSLYIIAEDDSFGTRMDLQRRAFSRMGTDGELLVTPSDDRGMVDQFGDEIDTVVEFFNRVL